VDRDLLAPIIALVVFASGVAGLAFSAWRPVAEQETQTRDLINRLTGLVATLTALALGLLVAQANDVYNAQKNSLELVCTRVIQLDGQLRRYGPDAAPARAVLKDFVRSAYEGAWNGDRSSLTVPTVGHAVDRMDKVFAAIDALRTSAAPAQQYQLAKAADLAAAINDQRLQMSLQLEDSLSWPLIVVLSGWLVVLFFGIGMLAPLNRVGVVGLAAGAVTVASAMFLIVELSDPYVSLLRLSPRPLVQTIQALGD
jgi:hypothetical protein